MNNSSGSSTSASALCRSNVLQWISLCLFLALLQHVQSFTATPIAGETITRYSFASMVANSMYYQDEPSSTSTKSSFQDRMKRVLNKTPESSKPPKKPSHQESLIPDVTSLKEFKNAVVETDTIVVVRFYAPWCRACKAMAPTYLKFARQFSDYKFIQVPISSDNASLHQGLGVNSVPFVHVYHPIMGLIEEQKVTRKHLPGLLRQLNDYRLSQCSLEQGTESWSTESPYGFDEHDEDEVGTLVTKFE